MRFTKAQLNEIERLVDYKASELMFQLSIIIKNMSPEKRTLDMIGTLIKSYAKTHDDLLTISAMCRKMQEE